MPYLVITDQSPNVCFGEVLEMGEDGDSSLMAKADEILCSGR